VRFPLALVSGQGFRIKADGCEFASAWGIPGGMENGGFQPVEARWKEKLCARVCRKRLSGKVSKGALEGSKAYRVQGLERGIHSQIPQKSYW